jgi:hypothetical protein
MRTPYVNLPRPSAPSIERLARWWTSATAEARFALLRAAIHGEADAPRLGQLRTAIILAEVEAGEIGQG